MGNILSRDKQDIWIEPHPFLSKHSICVGGSLSYTSLNLTQAELVVLEKELKKYMALLDSGEVDK